IDGFSASTGFFPTDSLGIVVLTNQNSSPVPNVVRNFIADRMLGLPFVNWNTQISNGSEEATTPDTAHQEDVARMRGTRPSHVLADYTGSYQNPAYGTFTLRLRNDTLLTAIGKQRVWLRHYHYDVFDLKGFEEDGRPDTADGGMKINFRIGVDGQVEGAVIPMDPSLDPVEFKRQPLVQHLSEAQMQAYAGFYELA